MNNDSIETLINNVLYTAIRFSESWKELEILGLNPEESLRFLALPRLYHYNIIPYELTKLKQSFSDFIGDGKPNLLVIPHPDDPQSVHSVVAEAAIRALEPEKEWHIWYYQSPWYTMHPENVDLVISMDEEVINAKKTAAAKHRSQVSRTPYSDIVTAQASLNADVLPEQLLGYGGNEPLALGRYCELYQIRKRRYYMAHENNTELIVYSRHSLPIEN